MSWQDELRQLDARLADGRIEHTEYRKLRDELLAAASSGGITATALSWHSANPGHEPAPRKPSASLLDTDRQTSAPSPADNRHTDAIGFPPIAPAPIPRSRPAGPLPPLGPAAQSPTPEPGMPTKARDKPVWAFLSLGVFLVLAMIIGATLWLGTSTDNTAGGTARADTAAPSAGNVALADRLPGLPGTALPNSSRMSIDRGQELGLYSAEGAEVIKASGADKVIYRGSADDTTSYMLLVVPTTAPAEAEKLASTMRESVAKGGFTSVTLGPDTAFLRSTQEGQVVGSWYTSARYVIGIGLSAGADTGRNVLLDKLETTLSSVSSVLPPS